VDAGVTETQQLIHRVQEGGNLRAAGVFFSSFVEGVILRSCCKPSGGVIISALFASRPAKVVLVENPMQARSMNEIDGFLPLLVKAVTTAFPPLFEGKTAEEVTVVLGFRV